METQQSYKFLTDLGLAQYDAIVRQYMEQTFAKKGETPSGSGVNIFDVTLGLDSEKDEVYIESFETQPEQIWESVNNDGFCLLRATLVLNKNGETNPENDGAQGIAQGGETKPESQTSTTTIYFVLSGNAHNDYERVMKFTCNFDGQSWYIDLHNGGEDWEYDIYRDQAFTKPKG